MGTDKAEVTQDCLTTVK